MRRALVIALALAGCRDAAPPPAAPVVYPAAASRWPVPPVVTRLGGGAPRAPVASAPIVAAPGGPTTPLAMVALVGADDGAAEAALSGRDADGPAIDLIDVDAGVVRWRNRSAALPAVAVLGARVFAAAGEHVVALERATGREVARLDGRWLRGVATAAGAVAAIATAGGVALLVDDRLGPPAALPAGSLATDVAALCELDGRFALAWRDGQLQRWDLGGAAVAVRWAVATPRPERVACDAAPIVVAGGGEVRAIGVDGALVGGPRAAADAWPDPRDPTRVELATVAGVERRTRDLATAEALVPVAVDHLIAARGARRLARDLDGDPLLLDGDRALALAAPAGEPVIVAGAAGFVAGPWRWPRVSQQQLPTRFTWPAVPTDAPAIGLAAPPRALAPAAARIDLPPAQPPPPGVERAGGAWAVGAVAIDPFDAERLYAVVLDDRPTATTGAGLASYDLHADRWRWLVPDGCPPGTPIALAAAGPVVACAARGPVVGAGAVRAVAADTGAPAWRWGGPTVDAILGGGGVVVILAGAAVEVVDAASGWSLARWRTSDGFLARIAVATRGTDTRIASVEHGALVVRSRAIAWLPLTATAIDGAVAAVFAVGDRWAVALTDGRLYLVADDGAATSAGVVAGPWQPRGDRAVVTRPVEGHDGAVLAVDARGIPRVAATLPGLWPTVVGARAALPGAPLAVGTDAGDAVVLDPDGAPLARVAMPDAAPQLFATVIDGAPAAGAVLAQPLRVVRFAIAPAGR
ncbi:MAG: hypothetical protein IPH44_36975 [Myxococcales bacterium]|nr:hypothetical protein [Myxococcales bacterium]